MKVALIQEWLTVIGGSENVFKEIASLFPEADIYTLVARDETIKSLGLGRHKVTTSFIQNLPFAKTKYRNYLPLFPLAIEQFDLSSYDLIISSSHAVAKGVLTHSGQVHVCYCHSPMRYAWDLYHQYIREAGLDTGLKGFFVKLVLHRIRQWDIASTNRVDHFISNSNYIGKRIKKIYNRESTTIYPNVAVEDFEICLAREDFYLTCSRLVPYKKIDLIVKAFNGMPDKKLIVIGDGPDFKKIKNLAADNIVMMGYQPFDVLKRHLSTAKAFVFAAEEDFGILPVEAQACGTPVIAYGKGGVTETVIENKTGVYFSEQTAASIIDAVNRFENNITLFSPVEIAQHASLFSSQHFRNQLINYLRGILPQNLIS
ncbi:glycosyltransferase family 4 protein [Mucilaginibacter gotjawali]|uniref:GDP-mannose-dependent alpha-(1-6)-phosphatidylinositol monomannoside mannosyltransferase n=2 Tax=Mucilaginibacter gotjawali TaxID=1550579 RepID=A0A0X8X619_9SPHI|nr:glycosyltransferase family 4 protein [Mucilaginibacter gotjawali]MBB3058533.1 glycosyltransferase involved in cell wall biosynthesis [Mucilaginibacter gotjawali]BAU55757.1 GDP-mannose-dependent alpha-(1-6)-phosphatidylinositol monomannoside mannosyltransferase [Mucilaginibacter gotjawali]